jgi:hypothetical protein
VRWYLTFKLSSRDLVQMMAERGIAITHTTISRWVQRYVPEFEKCWSRYARPVGDSWRRRQAVLLPGSEEQWKSPGDHLRQVRCLASGGRQIESGRNLAAPRADTLLQVLE